MKKIFFIAVFMTVLFSCTKENTSPTITSQTSNDDEKISMVVLIRNTYSKSYYDTISTLYDSNGRYSKIIYRGNTFGNRTENFDWDVNGNIILNNSIDIKLDNDNNCVFNGTFRYEYKDGYLFRYGIDKTLFIGENNIPKDTFLTCTWQNGNLITDGTFRYEYDLTKLNNNITTIKSSIYSIQTNENGKIIKFYLPYSYFNIPFFPLYSFGKNSKNLISKVFNLLNGSLLYDIKYDFDVNNRIKQITHTGSSENFVTKYIWSKY
jgi:hypothetical protein